MRRVAIVNQELRAGLIEKVTFEQRLEGRKAIRQGRLFQAQGPAHGKAHAAALTAHSRTAEETAP